MTQISVTDFRRNIKKYSELVQHEDLEVMNRGEVIFIVMSPKSAKREALKHIFGAAKSDVPYEDILKGKLAEL